MTHTLTVVGVTVGCVDCGDDTLPFSIASLLDVLGKEPNNGNATFNLALVYFDLGRHEDAELYYKKALSISPTDRGSLLNLGVLLTQLQRWAGKEEDERWKNV